MLYIFKYLDFKFMSLVFSIRDRFYPPGDILNEIPVQPGQVILDFGAGTGSFACAAAEKVGKDGKVFAQDVNLPAIRHIERKCMKTGMDNIVTIHSGMETGLDDAMIDVIIMYDVFHHLNDHPRILKEMARVLRDDGLLSLSDHHMDQDHAIAEVAGSGYFILDSVHDSTISFRKSNSMK